MKDNVLSVVVRSAAPELSNCVISYNVFRVSCANAIDVIRDQGKIMSEFLSRKHEEDMRNTTDRWSKLTVSGRFSRVMLQMSQELVARYFRHQFLAVPVN